MKLMFFVLVFGLLLLVSIAWASSVSQLSHWPSLGGPPARRSLLSLSNEHESLLVATLDGTINLVHPNSAKVIWSFASGQPIYSSYQAPVSNHDNNENYSGFGSNYFVDCGDDWKLYAYTELGKVNLEMTLEEFLSITPHIAEDGGILLGSKKTTVFLVDAKTGNLIYKRCSDTQPTPLINEHSGLPFSKLKEESESSGSVNMVPDVLPLYITRTDYSLQSVAANSGKVIWNVTVADIRAAFLCRDSDNVPPYSESELLSPTGVRFNMPLPCHSKAVVLRLRTTPKLDSLFLLGKLQEGHHEVPELPLPSQNDAPPSPSVDNFLDLYRHNNGEDILSLSGPNNIDRMSSLHDVNIPHNNRSLMQIGGYRALSVVSFFLFVICFSTYRWLGKSSNQHDSLNSKSASSKKKKLRKSGKNSGILEKKDINSSICDDRDVENRSRGQLLNLDQLTEGTEAGRTIGKLFVSTKEIAKGSNGTIVLEGIYEGRQVAVKRIVKSHHDVAFKEIQNLIASDRHPNIVRWYGVEYDQDFVYLSLERCTCSLNDLIQMYSSSFESYACTGSQATRPMRENKVRLDAIRGSMQNIQLWRPNGYPSPILLKLMRDVVSGLVHLHELGIIHRDLKPQNVLIIKERSLSAKLSDMGISKRLVGDMSSLGHHATGCGSSGWQAPEQLLLGRQTRAVDLFSLGCVLFFCITGGRHPFGDPLERDSNVAKNRVDLFLVECIPEAVDLFSNLLDPHAALRPKAVEVLHHPLFWNSEMRLAFLRDSSDRVELEDRESTSDILYWLESIAPIALGGKWDEKMEPAFIANIGRYRRYKYESVRDLLRVVRNKLNHYRELPKEIQELLGAVPEGYVDYFASRFPKLLIEVYKVMRKYCKEEEWFQKYLNTEFL